MSGYSGGYAPSAPPLPESQGHEKPTSSHSYEQNPPPPSHSYAQIPPPSSHSYGGSPVSTSSYVYGQGDKKPTSSQSHEHKPPPSSYSYAQNLPLSSHSFGGPPVTTSSHGYGQVPSSYGRGYPSSCPYFSSGHGSSVSFPPGTHPEIIRSFQMVDRDGSGFIDENELQSALSNGYQTFSLRTIRLLMFLFKRSGDATKIGPAEFAALWECLGQWRAIFDRFDRDRSGMIDSGELRDALLSLGYAIPPSVLHVLVSKYDESGKRGALNFDSFIECGLIIKGLTEKFKEKDTRYSGSATLAYDAFMLMVIPFILS
ncbi:probable calcium-binding protein CML48 [Amborella trichopoda]|nr:probable calcium-binding protein CML48 [Amborella trichopoda]|eukprot:XP_006855068.2 probable calcium-binding protein CML48 [Amborella trichopoda]